MTIASLIVDVLANTAQLTKDVQVVQASLDKVGDAAKKTSSTLGTMQEEFNKKIGTVQDVAKNAGAALAAMVSIGAVKSAVSSFVEFAGSLTDLSAKTGISTTELQKLKFAAEQNGGTLEQVTGGIAKMGKALVEGDTSTVAAMKRLGLSITDVRNMAPGEAFATISDAIAKVPNPLERSKLAMDLFGKSGADLLPMMTGNLSDTMKAADKLGIVLDEQTVAAGDNLGDTFTALQGVGMAILGKLLAPMLPAFQMVANAMLSAGNVVDYLRDMFDALLRVGLLAFKSIVDGAIYVGELAAKVPGLSTVLGINADAMQGLRDASTWLGGAIEGVEKGTETATAVTKKAVPPVKELTKAQQDQAAAADAVRKAQIPLTEVQKVVALSNEKLGISAETTAKQLGISAAAVTTFLAGIKNAEGIAEIWRKAHESMTDASHKMVTKMVEEFNAGQQKIMQRSAEALTDQLAAYLDYQEKNYQATLHGTDLTVRQIERQHDAAIDSLTKQFDIEGPLYAKAKKEIDEFYQHQVDLATGTADTIVERMHQQGISTMADLEKSATIAKRDYEQMKASGLYSAAQIEQAWRKMVDAAIAANGGLALSTGDMFKLIGQQAQEAFTRGGWTGLKDFAKQTAMDFASGMVDAIPVVGPILSKFVAPIAKILSGMFGTAGRDAIQEWAQSITGSPDLNQLQKYLQEKLPDSWETYWKMATQGVGRSNPEQAKKVIEVINAALGAQDAWMQRLPGLIDKYGLSWADAGQAAKQAHLDEIARGLIQDFADLSKAGFDVTVITDKMSASINDYIHQAMATGTEVPAAMKPLLEKMIEMGLLTDSNGNKIDDLESSGISFATTLTEGFKSVVDAIKELTKALGGVPSKVDIDFHATKTGDWPDSHPATDTPSTAATGGIVGLGRVLPFGRGGLVPFTPIGTDTVPAMLTPGEIILNAAQQRSVAGTMGADPALRREIAGLREDLRDQQRQLAAQMQSVVGTAARAGRDAALKAIA